MMTSLHTIWPSPESSNEVFLAPGIGPNGPERTRSINNVTPEPELWKTPPFSKR